MSPFYANIGDMISFQNYPFPPDFSEIYNAKLTNQLASTHASISALNQMKNLLHNPQLLMRPILAKEAESSSQLEGTQASIEDAYQIDITEQSEEKRNEAQEIKNYEEAMLTGLEIMSKTSPKISELLIRETHSRLMQGVRGQKKHPGSYRKDEVWIGKHGTGRDKAKYLPPDATQVQPLMENLLQFVNQKNDLHALLKCAVMHHRFEAIHPFKDGNGRVGRLLISFYLVSNNLLDLPILYPSGYFEANKEEYMSSLSKVDENNEWYQWLLFFLKALEQQANVSLKTALKINELFKESKSVIEQERANLNLIRVLEFTFKRPYLTGPLLEKELGIPRTTCDRYLGKLKQRKVVEFIGIHKKTNVFVNMKLIKLLRSI